MTQLGPLFWIVVTLIAAVTDYGVKHMVQSLDDELAAVRRKTITEQKEIHALTAAWTYLNQPETLAELNKRFLGLAPITAKQMERAIADIPLRPLPPPTEPPAPPPALLVAATAHDTPPPGPAAPPAAATPMSAPAPVAAPTSVAEAAKPAGVIPIDTPASAPAPPAPRTPAPPTPVKAAPPAPPATAPSLDTLFAQIAGKN